LSVKASGVPFWDIMKVLLVMPFMDIKNVASLYSESVLAISKEKKDVYYRALLNQNSFLFFIQNLSLIKSNFLSLSFLVLIKTILKYLYSLKFNRKRIQNRR